MADMLNIGASALQAFQQALSVTSNNISNASTPGYNRESVNFVATVPQTLGDGYTGQGVAVNNVSRSYSGLLSSQLWSSTSSYNRLDAYTSNAQALSNMLADSTNGLPAALQQFSNSVQGVANAPTSTTSRQTMLGQATQLTSTLQSFNSRLDQLDSQINTQLTTEASTITGIAKNIAQLNNQIAAAQNSSGQAPNALLDARDQQIAELSKHVSISVVNQADGQANIFVGNGQSLVLGSVAGSIVPQADAYNPTRVTLAFQASASAAAVPAALSGGTAGGLLDFRSQMLDPVRNQLGQIAVGVTSAVNAQQNAGLDLNGSLGGDLFTVGNVVTQSNAKNTGSGSLAVTRTGAAAVGVDDYFLSNSGGTWSMRDATTGAAITLSGTGSAASPLVGAGLSIVVSGAAASGDSFKLQPTAGAVSGMGVLITDPAKVAAAAALKTSSTATNTGAATISAGVVSNSANPALLTSASIQFADATHYSINGAGSYAYSSGGAIAANGWQVTISGTPVAGDSFTVAANTGAVGDNSNALAMAGALGKGLLNAGKTSVSDAATALIGTVGVATNQAQSSLSAQQIVLSDSQSAISSASGVNLDEEAANLVRYQQAYQAAAQVIKTTQTLFDSLMAAFR